MEVRSQGLKLISNIYLAMCVRMCVCVYVRVTCPLFPSFLSEKQFFLKADIKAKWGLIVKMAPSGEHLEAC